MAISRRSAVLGLAAIAARSTAQTTAAKAPPRIGFITGAGFPELEQAFTDELRRQGLVEGRDVVVVRRFTRANSDDGRIMGRELANSDLALVVPSALPLALVIREANPRMPMVIGTCPGMVANGFAQSMEHPGGIYTGIDELPPGVTARRLALLKSVAPAVTRVALLSTTPGPVAHDIQLADARRAAAELKIETKPYRASSLEEIESALDAMRADGMNGLQNFQGGLSLANRQLIVDYAAAHRLPAVYQARAFVAAGGLMAWAPDQSEQLRIAARMAAQILRGTRPGDIPVVYPPRYALLLNPRAARELGLEFSAELRRSAEIVGPG